MKLLRKFSILAICFTFVITNTASAYASKNIGLYPSNNERNLFSDVDMLLPGSKDTQQIIITNTSNKALDFYLHQGQIGVESFGGSVSDLQKSNKLLKSIEMKIVRRIVDSDGTVLSGEHPIYDGLADGTGGGHNAPDNISREFVFIGMIQPNATIYLTAHLNVSERLTEEDMGYAKFPWDFGAYIPSDPNPKDGTSIRDKDVHLHWPEENANNYISQTEILILQYDSPLEKLPLTGGKAKEYMVSNLTLLFSVPIFGIILIDVLEKRRTSKVAITNGKNQRK